MTKTVFKRKIYDEIRIINLKKIQPIAGYDADTKGRI